MRFELMTSALQVQRSNQLSYGGINIIYFLFFIYSLNKNI